MNGCNNESRLPLVAVREEFIMPRFDPVQSNFTAGEVSPKLLGNFQIDKYKQGLNKAENFMVEPTGGVRRRGGFKYVATVKTSANVTILQEFRYKDETVDNDLMPSYRKGVDDIYSNRINDHFNQ